jgi:hypothetical protein
MPTYTRELDEILRLHQLWLDSNGEDGQRADLRDVDLRGVNLRGADLMGADLRDANLVGAILRDAILVGVNLRRADLRRADLRRADLRRADLRRADLRDAILVGADFINSKISYTKLPSTGMVLLANWGELSPELTTLAMAYDRDNHPEPERFLEWVDGGRCPYAGTLVERACNFDENHQLYDHQISSPSAFELMEMILREKTDFEE